MSNLHCCFLKLIWILSISSSLIFSLTAKSVERFDCPENPIHYQYPPLNYADTLLVVSNKLARGEGLSSILMQYEGITYSEILELYKKSKHKKVLNRLPEGQIIRIYLTKNNCQLVNTVLPLSSNKKLRIFYENGKLISRIYQYPFKIEHVYREFTIFSSLFIDGAKEKVPEEILIKLENIFAGQIDFTSSLRVGDRFSVLYEKLVNSDNDVDYGRIIAVEFDHQRSRLWRVFDYIAPDNKRYYVNSKKKNMLRSFIRNPVQYSRISSRFSLTRKHPILHKIRAHRGVDFVAPIGTPVRAVGDGRVLKKYYSRSYGNVVFLQHNYGYTSVYAHLYGFARGLRKGKRVVRGQTIGYVGKSGLATGAHLHYELRINKRHRDPLKVKLPSSSKLNKKLLVNFAKQKKEAWQLFKEYQKNFSGKN